MTPLGADEEDSRGGLYVSMVVDRSIATSEGSHDDNMMFPLGANWLVVFLSSTTKESLESTACCKSAQYDDKWKRKLSSNNN